MLLDLFEHSAGLECVSRVKSFLGHEHLLHDPRAIDDKRRAAGDDVLFIEDAVGSADVALGIAQNGELQRPVSRRTRHWPTGCPH